jgi:hypothetical protein
MKINTGCILLFFLLLQLQLFGQGPITGFMPGGKGTDLALTYSHEGYDEYFFGRERQAIDYEVHSLSLFIEHGITDSLSIVVNLPYLRADELNKGLQDGAVWAKYRNGHDQFASGRLTQITAVGLSFPCPDTRL